MSSLVKHRPGGRFADEFPGALVLLSGGPCGEQHGRGGGRAQCHSGNRSWWRPLLPPGPDGVDGRRNLTLSV